jgi:hypothetical protein
MDYTSHALDEGPVLAKSMAHWLRCARKPIALQSHLPV